mgnify:FL=1
MKILGVDFGDTRTGVAISDINGFLASPLALIKKGLAGTAEEVANLAESNKAEKIVVGLPLNMDGSEGQRAERTRIFCEELKKHFKGEIILQDERMTTVSAHNIMIENNTKRRKKKDKVDKIAAVLILQTYLDSKRPT